MTIFNLRIKKQMVQNDGVKLNDAFVASLSRLPSPSPIGI